MARSIGSFAPAARAAPHCHGLATLFGPLLALGLVTPAGAQTATPAPAAFAGCDAACVRANTDRAVQACAPVIEAQSPTDFDWLNRPVPGIFQQAEQPAGRDFVVRYRGDSIRFQTPQHDWERMSYECGYDVEAKRVAFLNMHPGRLKVQLGPVAASTVLPGGPAQSAPPRNAQAMLPQAANMIPPGPGQAPASSQPKRPPPRVGEPSPIAIQQQPPRVRP